VYGHDGVARNVTMEPGEIILYESHSVIHGRPYPLAGRFFANVFLHFEPVEGLDQEDAETGTLLGRIAAVGDLRGVRSMLAAGVDVDQEDANRWRPLHEAARGGHLDVVKELVNTDESFVLHFFLLEACSYCC
jgi:hypothetical protein